MAQKKSTVARISHTESKAIRRLLNSIEHKVVTSTTSTVPTTAGYVVNTTAVVQGDDLADRTGRKIFIESLRFRVNQLATATNNTRFMLVRDRFNLGTIPGVTDILTSASVGAAYQSDNVIVQKRFQILMDVTKSYSLNGTLAGIADRYIKVQLPAFFSGAASTDEGSGLILLLVITDVATSSAIDCKVQTVYIDS
jgi:prephenate dehydratase